MRWWTAWRWREGRALPWSRHECVISSSCSSLWLHEPAFFVNQNNPTPGPWNNPRPTVPETIREAPRNDEGRGGGGEGRGGHPPVPENWRPQRLNQQRVGVEFVDLRVIREERPVVVEAEGIDHAEHERKHHRPPGRPRRQDWRTHENKPLMLLRTWPMRKFHHTRNVRIHVR